MQRRSNNAEGGDVLLDQVDSQCVPITSPTIHFANDGTTIDFQIPSDVSPTFPKQNRSNVVSNNASPQILSHQGSHFSFVPYIQFLNFIIIIILICLYF